MNTHKTPTSFFMATKFDKTCKTENCAQQAVQKLEGTSHKQYTKDGIMGSSLLSKSFLC